MSRGRPDAGPFSPAELSVVGKVFGMYGATMLSVQAFEADLAVLAMAVRPPYRGKRWDKVWEKLLADWAHRLERASAAELSTELEAHLDPDLWSEIEWAVEQRNILAHRYFRQHVAMGSLDDPARVAELQALMTRFQALSGRLTVEANRRFQAATHGSQAPPGFHREVQQAVASLLASGQLGEAIRGGKTPPAPGAPTH